MFEGTCFLTRIIAVGLTKTMIKHQQISVKWKAWYLTPNYSQTSHLSVALKFNCSESSIYNFVIQANLPVLRLTVDPADSKRNGISVEVFQCLNNRKINIMMVLQPSGSGHHINNPARGPDRWRKDKGKQLISGPFQWRFGDIVCYSPVNTL